MNKDITIIDGRLTCPKCSGFNLHHHTTKVFTRLREDGLVRGRAIRSSGLAYSVSGEENPSQRRHGLKISFTCEDCHLPFDETEMPAFILLIYQHKGETFIEWENPPPC